MSAGTPYSAGDVLLADVVFVDHEGQKRRPILVVSPEAYNRMYDAVVFVPITSVERPFGRYFPVDLEQGTMPHPSKVIVDRVQTIKESRIVKRLGRASHELLNKVLREMHRLIATPT